MKKPKVISFFAGIGGFDLGLERAGMNVVAQCEIDPFCQTLLRAHWPDVKLLGDISKVESKDLPDADVWAGGFPCQDVSRLTFSSDMTEILLNTVNKLYDEVLLWV